MTSVQKKVESGKLKMKRLEKWRSGENQLGERPSGKGRELH
jgi:hypothetical protein